MTDEVRTPYPKTKSCYNCSYFHKEDKKKCSHPEFHINPFGPAGVWLDKGCELFQSLSFRNERYAEADIRLSPTTANKEVN